MFKKILTNPLTKIIRFSFAKALLNQVAVITGAANGIGKATARKFADEGAKVVIADYQKEIGKETAKELRKACKTKNIKFKYTDCISEKSIKNLMKYTYKTFGGINILVNNASIFTHGHITGKGGSGSCLDFCPTD